jgi:hypothetical protein
VHWGSASSHAQVVTPVGSSARDHRMLRLGDTPRTENL